MNIKNYFNSIIDNIKEGTHIIASSPKTLATAGVISLGSLGIGAENASAQSTDSTKTHIDTMKIENYEPILTIRPNTEYSLNSEKSKLYTADPFYSVAGIYGIINNYDEGLLMADTTKNGISDIEMDYFRSLSVPGLAEYSMRREDKKVITKIGKILNNKNINEEIGDITFKENKEIFQELRNAGYLTKDHPQVKILVHKHEKTVMKLINGKKAIFPARDVVQMYIFEDEIPGSNKTSKQNTSNDATQYDTSDTTQYNNGCDTCDIVKPVNSVFDNTAVYIKNGLGYNTDLKLPTLNAALGLDFGKLSLGATGAYGFWMPKTSEYIANTTVSNATNQKAGTTIDRKFKNQLVQIGGEIGLDVSERFGIGVGAQYNKFDQNITGTETVNTYDDAGNPRLKIDALTPEKNTSKYWTWGPEIRLHLNDRVSAYVNTQFRQQKFNGVNVGIKYKLGR